MEKLIDEVEDRIGEIKSIIGLIDTSVQSVAEAISAEELPNPRLPYDALGGLEVVSEKLTAIVDRMYEHRKPKAA
jgi:hypothetical protein